MKMHLSSIFIRFGAPGLRATPLSRGTRGFEVAARRVCWRGIPPTGGRINYVTPLTWTIDFYSRRDWLNLDDDPTHVNHWFLFSLWLAEFLCRLRPPPTWTIDFYPSSYWLRKLQPRLFTWWKFHASKLPRLHQPKTLFHSRHTFHHRKTIQKWVEPLCQRHRKRQIAKNRSKGIRRSRTSEPGFDSTSEHDGRHWGSTDQVHQVNNPWLRSRRFILTDADHLIQETSEPIIENGAVLAENPDPVARFDYDDNDQTGFAGFDDSCDDQEMDFAGFDDHHEPQRGGFNASDDGHDDDFGLNTNYQGITSAPTH